MRDTKSTVFRSTFMIVVIGLLLLPLIYLSHKFVYGYEDSDSSQYTSVSEYACYNCTESASEYRETYHADFVSYMTGLVQSSKSEIEYIPQSVDMTQCDAELNEQTDSPVEESSTECSTVAESVLTKTKGVNYNIYGNKETWYNLDMYGVICIMRRIGFSEEEYPYWVREDGVKMLGDYIMVAANLDTYPRGSVVHTSLGQGLVCDTGEFAASNPTQLDIAVSW